MVAVTHFDLSLSLVSTLMVSGKIDQMSLQVLVPILLLLRLLRSIFVLSVVYLC